MIKWIRKQWKWIITPWPKCQHKNAKWIWLAQRVCLIRCPDCGHEEIVSKPDEFFKK